MRVLHVIPLVGPLRGGPSFVLRTLTRGLAERGVGVDVVTTDDNGPEPLAVPLCEPVQDQGVTYRYFRRQTRFYTCSFPMTRWLVREVRKYDLLHIHALFSYCSNAAAWIARRQGVPYIIRPLGVLNRWGIENRRPWLKSLSFRVLERRILADAALIHYTSEQERAEANQLGVFQKSVVIPNPAEAPPFEREELVGAFRARHPDLAGRKIILFLSRLDRKKGLDLLLPAFARLWARCPEAALVVAGSGDPSYLTALKRLAEQLGLGAQVLWAGFLAGREKWEALADADVFALPSYSENFGVAVLDALAFRLPVVISDQVAIHREISATRAGLVVPCEHEAVAEAIATLLSTPGLRSNGADNGEALVRGSFSVQAVSNRLIRVYRELLELTISNSESIIQDSVA